MEADEMLLPTCSCVNTRRCEAKFQLFSGLIIEFFRGKPHRKLINRKHQQLDSRDLLVVKTSHIHRKFPSIFMQIYQNIFTNFPPTHSATKCDGVNIYSMHAFIPDHGFAQISQDADFFFLSSHL